jgi:hypothetical protein
MKKMLKKELWDPSSRYHSMKSKDIHASNERFSSYPLKNFTTNFKSLKKKVDELRLRVEYDNLAVSQHKKMYPRVPASTQEYPYWDDHLAKKALEDDVFNQIAGGVLPSKLRMTRSCYQDFPSNIFCVRDHAESRKQQEQTFGWPNAIKQPWLAI